MDRATLALLPRIELLTEEANTLPQRASGARRAAALDLDHRRRQLDHASVEIHCSPRGQVIRPAGAVHHGCSHDACRAAEYILGLGLLAVDDHGEFRLQPHRRHSRGATNRAALDTLALCTGRRAHDALRSA